MRHDKQIINFANKEVVNYSAIANKAKSLSDGIRSIDFDRINDSIVFNSSLVHNRPKIHVKPSNNSINNVSEMNFNDNSTLTGITSDSSNTDPTKAISSAIMIDVNNRIEKLETKTQNQSATENETTFTGNVQADTFNGYHLGFNNRFYTLPAIPFINSDLVMEVGRYIDFHYNAASGTDKTSRLYISKPGTLYYDHSFIVSADIKARNCISDNGNLHDAINKIAALETKNTEQDTRLDALETKNTEQDTRLDVLESKNTEQDERIGSIEAMDTAQNETINNINTKNNEQDTRLDVLESKDIAFEERIGSIEAMDTAQNETINNINTKNNEQDTRLDTLESKDIAHEERLGSIEAMDTAQNENIRNINTKDNEQDTRLDALEIVNTEQDSRIDALDIKCMEQDTRLDTLESKTCIPYDNKLYNTYTVSFTPTLYQLLSTSITFELITEIPADLNTNNNSMKFGSFNWGVFQDPAAVSRTLSVRLFIATGTETIITAKDNFGHDVTASYVYNGHQFVYRITFNIHIGSSSSASISDISTAMINILKAYEVQNVSIVSKNLKIDNEERLSSVESKISNLLNSIYPVGSIYLSLTKSPPSLGGTWELISGGYFLQSTTTSSGETGGSTTHTHKTSGHVLTVGEMPQHKHTFNGNKITGTVYDIMKYDTTGQTNKNPEGAFSVTRYGSRTWQGTDGSNRAFSLTFTATPTGSISSEGKNQAHNHGNTEAEYHIPPYITCFMYKRTA